jgi:RNA polymerase sigma-70 factor (ECF subfamily)
MGEAHDPPDSARRPAPAPAPGGVDPLAPAWAAARRGDRAAMDQICRRFLPEVLQWCRRLGGPAVDADQATQDVFIVLLRKAPDVDQVERLPAWLYAVTRRVLAQHRRRAWVRRWIPGAAPAEERPHPAAPPDLALAGRAQARAVQAVLHGMPDDLREVLVLCDLEQRTDPEAAELLGLKVGTAKSRLRRARQVFRERAIAAGLGDPGEGPP